MIGMRVGNFPMSQEKSQESTPLLSSLFFKWLFILLALALFPFAVLYLLLGSGYESVAREFLTVLDAHHLVAQQALLQLESFRLQTHLVVITFFLLIVAGSIGASYFFSHRLREILHAIRKIRRGEPDALISDEGEDEIAALAWEINATVEQFKLVRERDLKLSQAKGDFISIVAHQLRTPLTGFKWSLDRILRDNPSAKEQQELLKKDFSIVEETIQLIGNLLNVVQIEEGRFGYKFEPLDIGMFIKKVASNIAHFAKSRAINIDIRTPSRPLPSVFADQAGMMIVLANLVSNAVTYSRFGGTVTVSCGVDETTQMLLVSVTDTGIGISPADLPHIFNKFFRARSARLFQPNGTGIGLFLSKTIIERHGGGIWAVSEPGKGTTFSFTLPLQEKDIPRETVAFTQFFEELGSDGHEASLMGKRHGVDN